MKVKVQTFFISLSIFAVVFIYCAMGHYDKMGIRSDEDSAQYYMGDGEIYVQNDAYIINVNNELKISRYRRLYRCFRIFSHYGKG